MDAGEERNARRHFELEPADDRRIRRDAVRRPWPFGLAAAERVLRGRLCRVSGRDAACARKPRRSRRPVCRNEREQREEINFDGLVGPTHNYAGLSEGNLASARNANMVARPREAALQGIAKMRRLRALGLEPRRAAAARAPEHHLAALAWLLRRRTAKSGSAAWKSEPTIARAALAASAMWAANAATISPSADCADGRLHAYGRQSANDACTAASKPSRPNARCAACCRTRRDLPYIPLCCRTTRCPTRARPITCAWPRTQARPALRFSFTAARPAKPRPVFPRAKHWRQATPLRAATRSSPRARCSPARAAAAIDAGAFHNDVVAVAHEHVLFHHEHAFADKAALYAEIRAKAARL